MWPETRFPDGLRPRGSQQPSAHEVQIGECAGDQQPMGVLLKTPVANLGEMKDALDDAKDVLDAAADLGLHAILGALHLVYDALVPIAAVCEVTGLRGVLSKTIGLALIRRVTPYPGLFAMEKIGQDGGVMNVRRGRHYGMNDLGLAVHADVGLHAEVPLIPLTCLMHVRIALLVLVLGGRRGIDDGGIDNRALGDLDALGFQMPVDLPEELFPQMVFLEQMAELQDGGLIGHRLPAQVDAHKPTHGDRFVQGPLRPRIGEVEPLLEEIDAQHTFQAHRRSAVLTLRIVGCDNGAQILPGHHLLHIRQELLATGWLPMGLEGAGG